MLTERVCAPTHVTGLTQPKSARLVLSAQRSPFDVTRSRHHTRRPVYAPIRAIKQHPRPRLAGLSLVESAALFGLAGVLIAVFVPTFVAQLRLSKVSEATEQLAALHAATAAYYATDHRVDGKLRRMCLPESAGPTPASPAVYPMDTDFAAKETPGNATWQALGMAGAHVRYSYQVIVAAPGCGPRENSPRPLVTFRAEGDLDGDGVRSTLERSATASSDQSTLTPSALLRVVQRVE